MERLEYVEDGVFGFRFKYDHQFWELSYSVDSGGSYLLKNETNEKDKTLLVVHGWERGQWKDEYVIMNLKPFKVGGMIAKRQWSEHMKYGKVYSIYFELNDYVISFFLTGWMDKIVVREFEKVARSFSLNK